MFFTKSLLQYRSIHVLAGILLSVAHISSAFATDFGMFATSPLSLHPSKTVSSGSTFSVSIGIKVEPGSSVSSYSMSVEFDTDMDNELNIISISQPASVTASGIGVTGGPLTPSGTPVGIDSTSSSKGTIMPFAGSTSSGSGIVNNGAVDVDVIVGSITFEAQSTTATDGADAFVGFFGSGDHVNFDSGASHTHIMFGDLAINLSSTSGGGGSGLDAPSVGKWGLGIFTLLLLWFATRRIAS